MICARLFWEFFKIGLFAIGGGMATIPFLQALAEKSAWFDTALITDMIAVSESTPGSIGLNMATYVGYNVAGPLGSLSATLGEICPALIIVTFVARELQKFRQNPLVENAFYGLRPAVTALIAAAFCSVLNSSFFHYKLIGTAPLFQVVEPVKLLLFAACFFAIRKWKKHPALYIGISAVIGLALKL